MPGRCRRCRNPVGKANGGGEENGNGEAIDALFFTGRHNERSENRTKLRINNKMQRMTQDFVLLNFVFFYLTLNLVTVSNTMHSI